MYAPELRSLDKPAVVLAKPSTAELQQMPRFTPDDLHELYISPPNEDVITTFCNPEMMYYSWVNVARRATWAVLDRNKPAGFIALDEIEEGLHEPSYIITRPHRGRGLAQAALSMVVSYTLSPAYLYSKGMRIRVTQDGAASHKIATKCGFIMLEAGTKYYSEKQQNVYDLRLPNPWFPGQADAVTPEIELRLREERQRLIVDGKSLT